MKHTILNLLSILLVSGCAFNPTKVTDLDKKTGKIITYHLSNNFCGYSIHKERGIGIFSVENGTGTNTGNFTAYVYNLSPADISIKLKGYKYYKLKSNQHREFKIQKKSSVKIIDKNINFDKYGNYYDFHYTLTHRRKRLSRTINMKREKHKTYSSAVSACKRPANINEFKRKANK